MEQTVEINLEDLTQRMDFLKDVQASYKFELNEVEKEIEQIELQLQAVLTANNLNEMQYGKYSFGWVERKRKAFDQTLFSQEQPELFAQYKIEKTSNVFKFRLGE